MRSITRGMPLRQALPFVALALVLLGGVVRVAPPGGAGAEEPRPFAPFGERVVATAPALPQYAVDAHARIGQQLASVNAMWIAAFADSGGEAYETPALGGEVVGCGGPSGGWAGVYCPEIKTIVIDVEAHVRRHAAAGQALADTVLGYVVAHEVGHHVQSLRGAPRGEVLRLELHADCLAGVWGKAAGIPLPPMWAYGEDAEHGTATQRVTWLNEGYRAARPAACDAILSTSTSP